MRQFHFSITYPLLTGLFAATGLVSGCSVINERLQMAYESQRAVQKGEWIVHKQKLFSFQIPEDNHYMEEQEGGLGLILVPRYPFNWDSGVYYIRMFPINTVPATIQGDLRKTFDWINETVIATRAKSKAEILSSHNREFQRERSLYLEYFVPGQIKREPGGFTLIERNSFDYAALIFYHKDRLFWLYRSNPTDPSDSIEPKVNPATGEEFKAFIRNFNLDPTGLQ